MNWLLWKEYRLNRVILFATLGLMVFPHLIAIYVALRYDYRWAQWEPTLAAASIYGLALSQVGLALVGGNAIAGERADRSAEFQVYLPLARRKILAGKLLLVLAITGVIWVANPLILVTTFGAFIKDWPMENRRLLLQFIFNTAVTGLTFFCVAWLCSSILRSPTFSVCAGFVAPALVVSGLLYMTYLRDIPALEVGRIVETYYRGICLAIAPPCFAVGTWLYLRRVEP